MQKKIKQNNGFTLIEALIAIILLSIFSLMLVQGIRMSVNAFNINKIKTQAVTIANEEIEKIKSMPFNDIGLLDGNPQGSLQRQKYTEDGFLIEYEVTFVNEDSRLKQIIVSVLKEPMVKKLEVVTEIGLFSIGEGGSETTTTVSQDYSPPHNLRIISDTGNNKKRVIVIEWDDPVNPYYSINSYNIFRDSSLIANTIIKTYEDRPESNDDFSYYVTIIYSDGTESAGSNEVSTQ